CLVRPKPSAPYRVLYEIPSYPLQYFILFIFFFKHLLTPLSVKLCLIINILTKNPFHSHYFKHRLAKITLEIMLFLQEYLGLKLR
ncbi:MAG: hypothetical protein PHU48_00325, partial [Candidatus Cloacimonetes bacterium]|nr:hypothetical protein [Candidatus Cloacimonadota bacterium]